MPVDTSTGPSASSLDVPLDTSTRPSTQPEDDTSVNVVRDSPSHTDADSGSDSERTDSEGGTEIRNIPEKQGEDVSKTVAFEEPRAE